MPERPLSGAPDSPPPSPARVPFWHRGRIVVVDESMRPTLRPGDRLLLDRSAYRRAGPRVGDVVVLVDPERPARWLVKRVAAVDPAARTAVVLGDAADVARDSRRFGPVPFRLLVGRAYRLYFPPGRARDL
ncbi:MAG TPA: S26 family signal peptidase [Thermoplasmata archaeon]|nr:S26 family signal peptidase [Thermoplasmata archaeon]